MLCTYQDMLCTYQDILQTPSVAAPLNGLTCLTAFRGCFLKFTFLISTILLFSSSSASRRITAKLGSSEVLHCNISERILQDFSSEHMLEWRKRSRELPIFITFNGYPPHVDEEYQGRLQLVGVSSLLLSNIQAGDEGWYNCFVVFIEKSRDVDDIVNGSWTYLSLQVPPTLIKSSPSFVTGRVGETLELHCDASGAPQPIISWHKNGKELPTVPLISVHHNNNNNHLDNHLERAMLQRTNVLQHHPPSGLSIRNSARQSRTVWSNSVGVEFASSEVRRMIMYDYNLQIPNLEKSDSGLYTCTLTNAAGHAQHMIRLIVEDSNWTYSGSAYITVPPNNQTSMEGTRVKLSCHAEGSPNTITYNWYKDNISVQSLPSLMSSSVTRLNSSKLVGLCCKLSATQNYKQTETLEKFFPESFVSNFKQLEASQSGTEILIAALQVINVSRSGLYADGSLVIKLLLKEDMGWYKCMTFNGVGQPAEATAFLNVTYLPRVIASSQEKMQLKKYYLARGLTGRIDCPVDANPPASVIMWSKNDRFIVPSNNQRLRISKHGMLIIRDIDSRDEGFYSCLPYSPLGKGNKSESFQVHVREAPHFSVRPDVFYQRRTGDSVFMPCLATGDPAPNIRWQKVDGPFPPSTKTMLNDGNLTIAKLDHSDAGLYECLGLSPVITIIASSYLIIENSSHPAEIVSVICSNESATISWLPAFHAGQSLHYMIWYREFQEKDFSEWKTVPVQPSNSTLVTLHGLRPNKVHHFQVSSTSLHGVEMTSNSMACSTKESSDVNANHHSVSHSNSRRSNSTMDYVTQEYSEDRDDEDDDNGDGDGDGDGDEYERSEGEHKNNDNDVDPGEEVRLLPPTSLHVFQTRTGLNITWQPPLLPIQGETNSEDTFLPVRYYLIQFKTMGQWVALEERIPSGQTHHLWTTASRGASYSFRMFSVNGQRRSNASQIFTLKTDADLLPFVGALTSSAVGGLMGLLVFLIFAVICSIIAFKYFVKWRQREKISSRYGNVKYIGPHQVDGVLKNQHNNIEVGHTSQKEVTDEMTAPPLADLERISEEKAIKETPI